MGRIAELITELLAEIGEDPTRAGVIDTPQRVERMYQEICAGLKEAAPACTAFDNEEHYDQMVIVKDIPFYSLCEHHLVPFFGKAHVGYLPADKYIGLSKIARVVEHYAKRPQVQERLTKQVSDYLFNLLEPAGIIVVLEAEHLCMSSRGVKKPGTKTITSAIEGNIDKGEFLSLLRNGG